MKNRIIGILIAITAASAVFSGCGSRTADTTSTQAAADNSTAGSSTSLGAAAAGSTETAAENSSTTSSDAEPAEKTSIHIATAGGPSPYVIVKDDHSLSGYDIEVLKSAFSLLPQYDPDFQITEFSSMFTGLTSGTFDIAANFLSYNEDRGKSFLFSYPYEKTQYVFYTNKSVGKVNSFDDLSGKSIESTPGLSTATAIEAWNEKNPDKAIKIDYTESDVTQQFNDVASGKYDFGISDAITASIYTDQNGEFKLDLNVYPMSGEDAAKVAPNAYAYYLLGPDDQQLREDLDGALKNLRDNGTLQQLSSQYLGGDYVPEESQYEKTVN